MSFSNIEEKTNVVDGERISQHIESPHFADEKENKGDVNIEDKGISQHVEAREYLDEEDLKGDLDIGVEALRGQDLTSTEEGKFNDNSMAIFWELTCLEKHKVLRKIDWHIIPLAAWACGLQFVDKVSLITRKRYFSRRLTFTEWARSCCNLWSSERSSPGWQSVFLVCFGMLSLSLLIFVQLRF